MICDNCKVARDFPEYRLFNPACLYCGARMLQRLGRLSIPLSECTQRRREALAVWVKRGHSEPEIRRLYKGPPALQPDAPKPKKKR